MKRLALATALIVSPILASAPAWAAEQSATTQVTAAPIDAARLAAARPVVLKLFPVGTYKRMMGETMSKMMDAMLGSAMTLPIAQIAAISGVPSEQVMEMGEAKLGEITAIVDPHFRQRSKAGMDAMMGGMAQMMDGYEPKVRDALTRAFARRFSTAELGEISTFFATSTGNRFAGEYMMMFMDPEIMSEMQALMPDMMKNMPKMVEQAKAATKDIPAPRKIADLSASERTRLATLLGMKEKDLTEPAHSHEGAEP